MKNALLAALLLTAGLAPAWGQAAPGRPQASSTGLPSALHSTPARQQLACTPPPASPPAHTTCCARPPA